MNQELKDEKDTAVVNSDGKADANRRRSKAMKGKTNARIHGAYGLKTALQRVGTVGIDRRTSVGIELQRQREQIIQDCGGREVVGELKDGLIEKYLRTNLLIGSIDNYLLSLPSLVRKRNRSLFPIVQQRVQLVDSALRLAQAIGLDIQKPAPKKLSDRIAEGRSKVVSPPPVSDAWRVAAVNPEPFLFEERNEKMQDAVDKSSQQVVQSLLTEEVTEAKVSDWCCRMCGTKVFQVVEPERCERCRTSRFRELSGGPPHAA